MTNPSFVLLVSAAAAALRERKEEVNKLNVFPVPDGDTGTNMSLTMDTVVSEVVALPADADLPAIRKAITHGSLMGARGNSGVITSQILRGLCEGLADVETFDAEAVAVAFERSVDVAFQAVRKPVEGTMLTVLRDSSIAARLAADEGLDLHSALHAISDAAFESVKRTPELLPVLKENGVVDAGGFGLSIMMEAFVAAATGDEVSALDLSDISAPAPKLTLDLNNDWEGSEFLYCTEFLFVPGPEGIDQERVHDFLAGIGDSELIVGDTDQYKVHVHTDDPGSVLSYMTSLGQVADVHIHNMRVQSGEREASLAADAAAQPKKPLGFIAVAAGEGMARILESIGVDYVVSGGQTMNPSTKDLLDAVEKVHADQVIILPNNKNIILAANAAAQASETPVHVVPTTSVPEAFAAMFVVGPDVEPESLVREMTLAASYVHTGEVTRAVKDAKSKAGDINDGDIIGIADHEIEVVGSDLIEVALDLIEVLASDDGETLTILAGEELSDEELAALLEKVEARYPDLEVDSQRGDQPLYPIVMSVE